MNNENMLTNNEWAIMEIIWENGSATFKQIFVGVKEHEWSQATVQSFLKRMETKGTIRSEKMGSFKKRYFPLISKEDAIRHESKLISQKIKGRGRDTSHKEVSFMFCMTDRI